MPPLAARIYVQPSRAAAWSRRLGALTVPVLTMAALGHRTGVIPTDAILPVLVLGFGVGCLAAGLGAFALADIWVSGAHGMRNAVIGIAYATPALLLIAAAIVGVVLYPRMTDISTDTLDPPAFSGEDANADVDRSLQAEAYPDVTARTYPVSIERAYAAAKIVVADHNWQVTRDEAPPEVEPIVLPQPEPIKPAGRTKRGALAPPAPVTPPAPAEPVEAEPRDATIEGTARTLLFALPDRVILRLAETDQGTRVDMRSASEIGTHDLGQNARRITGFLDDLDATLQGLADAAAAAPPAPVGRAPAVPPGRPSR